LAKQKPHRRFGSGVLEIPFLQSEPDRRAAQQQRVVQPQSKVQISVHTGKLASPCSVVNPFQDGRFYPAKTPVVAE
jgi:hypothetical protein